MKTSRAMLLACSAFVMASLLGGGLVVKVGAAESSYKQAVLFAEVLSQVLDNYVDPVDADALLDGAYEGMLGALDPNGAYLTPDEVREWKSRAEEKNDERTADPGFSVLKAGSSVQIVTVVDGSAAAEAGIRVGDHLRSLNGVLARDLSLHQVRRRIEGAPGTTVTVEVLHPDDGFRREELELARTVSEERPYELNVSRGTAILRIRDLRHLPLDEIGDELDDVRSRPVPRLLLDLRNLTDGRPQDAARVAALFTAKPGLKLRDRSGRLVQNLEAEEAEPAWPGALFVLVNGATADGAEALAMLLREGGGARIFGVSTFGLGAEPKLFELQDGSGLLLSAELWETAGGASWHENGVKPDEEVEGEGRDFASKWESQLDRVLDLLDSAEPAERKAA